MKVHTTMWARRMPNGEIQRIQYADRGIILQHVPEGGPQGSTPVEMRVTLEWDEPNEPAERGERRPFCCPVCNGAGTVNRPPNIAGDQPSWVAASAGPYECRACKGTGIVWG